MQIFLVRGRGLYPTRLGTGKIRAAGISGISTWQQARSVIGLFGKVNRSGTSFLEQRSPKLPTSMALGTPQDYGNEPKL